MWGMTIDQEPLSKLGKMSENEEKKVINNNGSWKKMGQENKYIWDQLGLKEKDHLRSEKD